MKINDKDITVIGITGTIGVGKSTLGEILKEFKVPVIDTDKIVRTLLDADNQIKQLIKEHFASVIKDHGHDMQIDRKELARIIFNDKKAKAKLESILHPRVRQICRQQIMDLAAVAKQPAIIAVLVPLLFENQLQSEYDQTWTVTCDEKILRRRLLNRDGLSSSQIDKRLAGQMPQQEKAKLADVILDNSGNVDQLRVQAMKLLSSMKAKASNN